MYAPKLPVSLAAAGIGLPALVPTGTTNGAPLPGTRPDGAQGVRIYLATGDSISYAMARDTTGAPTSAPTPVITIAGPFVLDEFLPVNVSLYVTAITGAPVFRWM